MPMTARRWIARLAPGVLGLAVGCSPMDTNRGGGCNNDPPRASDAGPVTVTLVSHEMPCRSGGEVVRGSDPHVFASFTCPGRTSPFLIALKVDGEHRSMREVVCPDYGYSGSIDLGSFAFDDTLWHDVEVILDPLNLFKEVDETNNRVAGQLRLIDPEISVYPDLCYFRLTADAGPSAGTPVTQVTAGTPVNVWLTLDVNGKYDNVQMSIRSGTELDEQIVRSFLDCTSVLAGQLTQWYVRWTPPGPGAYDVEFRVVPAAGAIDRIPTNNVVVKRLTVIP